MKFILKYFYLMSIAILLSFTTNSFSQTKNEPVELAIQELKKGHYQRALQLLKSPIANVSTHPDRQNALGLSYYFLQQYTKAKTHFKLAQDTPRRYEAAFYLGEIARKLGENKQAKFWYSTAANQYEDTEVQAQAEKALLRLSLDRHKKSNLTSMTSQNYLFLAFDLSDIDGIIDPDDTSGNDISDISKTFLVAGNKAVTSVGRSGIWKLGAYYYSEKYSDVTANNSDDLKLFTTLELTDKKRILEINLAHSTKTLDGQNYLDKTEIGLKNTWYNQERLILSGLVIDVSSPDGRYAQYAGVTTELAAEIRGGNSIKWQLYLKWRDEDRLGLSTELSNDLGTDFTGFTAYAREMLTLGAKVTWSWSDSWQQKIEVSTRDTQYQDDDVFLFDRADTELSTQTRNAVRTIVKAELIHHLSKNLDLNMRYENTEEDFNDDGYDYDSQRISLGMSYIF